MTTRLFSSATGCVAANITLRWVLLSSHPRKSLNGFWNRGAMPASAQLLRRLFHTQALLVDTISAVCARRLDVEASAEGVSLASYFQVRVVRTN